MKINLKRSIQQLLLAGSTAAFAASTLAALGQQNPPPGPGEVPDYFGITGNFANSPEPVLALVSATSGTGTGAAATTTDYASSLMTPNLMDVQGGKNYKVNDTVTVTDGGTATCTVTVNNIDPTTGAIIPNIDAQGNATPGVTIPAACSTALFTTPIAGTGIRKFVDALPGLQGVSSFISGAGYTAGANDLGQALPVAVADTTTFPGSDYYVIGEVDYSQKLHSDLPPTKLRGYVQLDPVSGAIISGGGKAQYLGPIIVAQKDRPVRIKLVNKLGTGAAGELPFPVDHTYMGADGATDTDNRTAMHLHGGNTPWISDGTARQWVKPKGEAGANRGETARNVPDMWFVTDVSGNIVLDSTPGCQGQTDPAKCAPGATNDPGAGALTFFYTNQQSQRLMFYHDHAEGVTRLNVYAGMAGGYVLQDPTEQAMVSGGTVNGATYTAGTLPPLADTIPLIIQEKTFVPDNTKPVLNFYGPFKSQLQSSDPTWRWTSGNPVDPLKPLMGNGDLWVPHVFMPNQNPGDITGANAVGRWDYGAWFWPPFANLQNGPIANPYFDPACDTTTQYCEPNQIPGVPNGATIAAAGQTHAGVFDNTTNQWTSSPSGTPEAFNDTSLVNGTAYPYINVDPKQYRLRFLSVGNDRMLNLSLVVAASKNSDTTAAGNTGTTSAAQVCDGSSLTAPRSAVTTATSNVTTAQAALESANAALAAGTGTQADVDSATANLTTANAALTSAQSALTTTQASIESGRGDCTEVKHIPWDAAQDKVTHFPAWWYTAQKGGVTFDGRPSGVFDPAVRGPAMVQIGTEGGFLSTPVVIKNQPVNYEYNPKNILIGNVKEHALLLGPAERADVLVDFTNFAGSTLILYNDSPAPMPAWDLRLDYYTGNYDNTDTGGAFSVIPGYGPNTRTVMQIRVSTNGGSTSHIADDLGKINMATLTPAVQAAFKTSQEPIIVPQAAYNDTYGVTGTANAFKDALGADLSRITDTKFTYQPIDAPNLASTGVAILEPTVKKLEFEPKSIIEDWTMNWGRMNALLGVEIPRTTSTVQTSIPQAYIDPVTEIVKITPNDNMQQISGVDLDGTQIWKITHNGVDSHAIHFHLFHVQIINRAGWDGAVYAPDANELGWKDTVRMNPLSDTIVALRPMTMKNLPFKTPNSHRRLDPARPLHAPATPNNGTIPTAGTTSDFFNLDPLTGNASTVTNEEVNFGWEYLWHCHILGHEENDMMRTISAAQPPEAPTAVSATGTGTSVTVSWKDNSVISNWVTIQRALDSGFTTGLTTFNVPVASLTNQVTNLPFGKKECDVQAGCLLSYTDTTAPANTSVYYRIIANNTVGAGINKLDGPRDALLGLPTTQLPIEVASLTPGLTGYANVTANSNTSNTVSRSLAPVASVTPGSIAFPQTNIGSTNPTNTAGRKVITIANTGNATLNVSNISLTGAFARGTSGTSTNTLYRGSCPTTATFTLAAGANCTYNVTFSPTAALCTGATCNGTLTVTDNSNNVVGSTQTVSLSGTTPAPVTPSTPATPTTASVTATGLTLNWAAVTGATSYTVQRATAAAGPWTTIGSPTTNTLSVTGLAGNTTYYFQVSATNAVGTSAYSAVKSQLTIPGLPTAVTAVNGTVGTPITAGLTWTAPANGATSYDVRYAANQVFILIAAPVTNVASGQQITVPAATRFMQVRAVNASGTTAWSAATGVLPQ